jgi:hypothetical protein
MSRTRGAALVIVESITKLFVLIKVAFSHNLGSSVPQIVFE